MPVDILAIGAHMGDEIAWGAALIAQRRQGASLGMLHLTPGEKGHRDMKPADYAVQKRAEAAKCAELMGAQMWTLDYWDGELPVNDEVKFQICDIIREAKPKLIITHWPGSMHKDHTAAAENLPDAIFYAALPGFERPLPHHASYRYLHGENWEDQRGYVPEIYLELKQEDLDQYEVAMRAYELFRGGISSFPYLEYYKSLARTRGCEIGTSFATTFAVPEFQRRRRLTSLL
jgi:LmbE family N-acetylglucosaminyl deacetylase